MNDDRQLQHDVLQELAADPSVNAEKIGVTANGGIVCLSGRVGSFYEKWQAEKAAQRVLGVRGLTVDMEVTIPSDHQRTDEDIARSTQMVLGWNAAIPQDAVKVMVENGWVTLRGELAWNFQRDIAEKIVTELLGVQGVTNQIELTPHVSGVLVKDQIDVALKRQAVVDAQKISVKVEGGKVTLEGTVSNWAERDVIKHAVWSIAGVQSVVDKMQYGVSGLGNF